MDPPSGRPGDRITVDGANFVAGETSVRVGGVEVDATVTDKATVGSRLTFVVPDGAELGRGSLTVTTPYGFSVLPDAFTVLPADAEATTSSTAPPATTPTGGGSSVGGGSSGGALPRTGTSTSLAQLGTICLVGGTALLVARRRVALRR